MDAPIHSINNVTIDRVKSFHFLGSSLDENMMWKSHTDKIKSKISKLTGIINRLKNVMPLNIEITLYNALILPYINYNLNIWGHHSSRIANIQKRGLKAISCTAYNAHSVSLFKNLNLLK